jgi:hypothetical protein
MGGCLAPELNLTAFGCTTGSGRTSCVMRGLWVALTNGRSDFWLLSLARLRLAAARPPRIRAEARTEEELA